MPVQACGWPVRPASALSCLGKQNLLCSCKHSSHARDTWSCQADLQLACKEHSKMMSSHHCHCRRANTLLKPPGQGFMSRGIYVQVSAQQEGLYRCHQCCKAAALLEIVQIYQRTISSGQGYIRAIACCSRARGTRASALHMHLLVALHLHLPVQGLLMAATGACQLGHPWAGQGCA